MYQTVMLSGGRTVGYESYGVEQGPLVFGLHGWPNCGVALEPLDEPARRLGVRLVAPDRPGIRSSTCGDRWQVVDVGRDILDMADALGAERFGVIGWSGGGPYALAVAALAGRRLLGTVVVASPEPFDTPEGISGYPAFHTSVFRWSRGRVSLARLALRALGLILRLSPRLGRALLFRDLSPRDREVFTRGAWGETPRESLRFICDALRSGVAGSLGDCTALSGDWGFGLETIDALVHVWQGDDDRLVRPVHARNLTTRLSSQELTMCAGEGHLIIASHGDAVLRQAAGLPES